MTYDPIDEGYIRLACVIGEERAKRYRDRYFMYLRTPNPRLFTEVKSSERKLKKAPTNLTDDQIRSLQKQVERNPYFIRTKLQKMQHVDFRDISGSIERISSMTSLDRSIVCQWVHEYDNLMAMVDPHRPEESVERILRSMRIIKDTQSAKDVERQNPKKREVIRLIRAGVNRRITQKEGGDDSDGSNF